MYFTTFWKKEKEENYYFKSKNWFTATWSTKKIFPLCGSLKNLFKDISSQKNCIATILREKKVDPCYLDTIKNVHNTLEQEKRG